MFLKYFPGNTGGHIWFPFKSILNGKGGESWLVGDAGFLNFELPLVLMVRRKWAFGEDVRNFKTNGGYHATLIKLEKIVAYYYRIIR